MIGACVKTRIFQPFSAGCRASTCAEPGRSGAGQKPNRSKMVKRRRRQPPPTSLATPPAGPLAVAPPAHARSPHALNELVKEGLAGTEQHTEPGGRGPACSNHSIWESSTKTCGQRGNKNEPNAMLRLKSCG